MGLDMYLEAHRTAFDSDIFGEERKQVFDAVVDAVNARPFLSNGFAPSVTVNVEVGYWRKANAIHNWFIQNCADGMDDCRPVYVEREQLEELRDLCNEALTHIHNAPALLPTTSGFFFGSTEYDEWYVEDLKGTVELLDRVLTNVPEGWDFYYRASW